MRHRYITYPWNSLIVCTTTCTAAAIFFTRLSSLCTDRTNWYPRGIHYRFETVWITVDDVGSRMHTILCDMPAVLTILRTLPIHLRNVSLLIYDRLSLSLKKKRKKEKENNKKIQRTSPKPFKIILHVSNTYQSQNTRSSIRYSRKIPPHPRFGNWLGNQQPVKRSPSRLTLSPGVISGPIDTFPLPPSFSPLFIRPRNRSSSLSWIHIYIHTYTTLDWKRRFTNARLPSNSCPRLISDRLRVG